MKISTTKLALVCFLWIYFSLSSGNILAQEVFKRKVDFDIDQDGVSLSGSATIAAEFIFNGYSYIKVKYSDLTINTLSYKDMYFSNGSNRDILAFPFKPENGGYFVNAEMIVSIAYVDLNGELAVSKNLMSNTFDENIKSFTIKDKIYTLTDYYGNDAIDDYFRELNHPKYKAADFWERSALIDAKITGLSPNILRQMTMIIDAKLREKKEKEEKEKETDKEKEEDDFDDFLNGGTKVKDDKKNTDDNFDDFLSGKKNVNDQKTSQAKSKDDFDEFLRNGKVTVVELDGNGDSYVTDKGVFYLSGLIKSTEKEFEAIIVGEDFNQEFEISNNSFNIPIILKSGANNFTIKVNNFRKKININSTRRPVKLRATLLWNTSGSDIDLHMVDNEGNECYYSNKRSGLMNLDVDNTSGFGPENIYVNQINSGTYTVYVNNYSGGIGTEATIYIYVDEVLTQTEKVKFKNGKNKILIANLKF